MWGRKRYPHTLEKGEKVSDETNAERDREIPPGRRGHTLSLELRNLLYAITSGIMGGGPGGGKKSGR